MFTINVLIFIIVGVLYDVDASRHQDRHHMHNLPGGITVIDPTDPKNRELAEDALNKYLVENEIELCVPFNIIVEHATEQIVSGTIRRLLFEAESERCSTALRCITKVWEQPWLKKKDIDVQCLLNN